MSLKNFTILEKLGEGAYSVVYKVSRNQDGEIYALKKVKINTLSDKQKQNALNEVRILASIRHNNIIGFKEVFLQEDANSLCIVMEFCDDGDLFQKITAKQQQKSRFDETFIWRVVIDIVKGLKALHDFKILHRDMKSANVFLTKKGVAKLGDMNVSKVAKKGLLYTQTGTPYYASPQVWDDKPYDSKSDIWSLGCVIYQICSLKPPFRANDMEGLYKKVMKGEFTRIPKMYSSQLSQLVKLLLNVDPTMRPSCDKILQLPSVVKRINQYIFEEADETVNALMNTIRIPKNIKFLTDKLPKPNYSPLKLKPLDKKSQNVSSFIERNQYEKHDKKQILSHEGHEEMPKLKLKNNIYAQIKKQKQRLLQRQQDLFDHKKLMIDNRRRDIQSIENIIGQRNQRIRMIYGQARQAHHNKIIREKQNQGQINKKINLPSLNKVN